jgi:hypothetical protein
MLTHDRVKPYLLHADRTLRSYAIDYLADCYSPDPELLPMFLRTFEQFPGLDGYSWEGVYHARNFTVAEEALAIILDKLQHAFDEELIDALCGFLGGAPLALLSAHAQELRALKRLGAPFFERFERRQTLAKLGGEELWRQLGAFADVCEEDFLGDIDWDRADDLVEALAPHHLPDEDALCRLLADEPDNYWLEIFLVRLAGLRRCRPALPLINEKLGGEGDFLNEAIADALVRINDPHAATLIRQTYPAMDFGYRVYAGDVLGRLKHAEAEEAALALLEGDDEPSSRACLGLALCELGSERGIAKVRQVIEEGYDRSMANLQEDLLTVATVLGVTVPEADAWRREMAQEESRRQRIFQRSAQKLAQLQRGNRLLADAQARSDSRKAKYGQPALKLRPAPVAATTTARVGRNERCPCGSGKKFKQCCLKRS